MDENSFLKQDNEKQDNAKQDNNPVSQNNTNEAPVRQTEMPAGQTEAPSMQPDTAVQTETPIVQSEPATVQPQTVVAQPVANDVQPKKGNRTTLFLVIVLIVVLLGAGGAVLAMNWNNWFGDKSQSGSGTSESGTIERKNLDNSDLSAGKVTTTIDGKEITYSAAYVVDGIEATIGSGTFESNVDDQVTFLVINGGKLVIDGDNVTINKTGSESFEGRGDNYSFYGLNSAVVVVGENSSVEIYGGEINTSVGGANAVMAIDGGVATLMDTVIKTTKDGSRGLHASFGGAYEADNVTITTAGASSAAIATDRGTGMGKLINMTLETSGAGSPLIYSTGSISISNSTGVAKGAQIAVIEGSNSIDMDGCDFKTNGIGNRNNVDNAGVMIYQSMSGDAAEGLGTFAASNSNLSINSDSSIYDSVPFFFVTNTTANIELNNTVISFSDKSVLISAIGTSEWGRAGANGGIVTFAATDLESTNTEVTIDSISSVTSQE